MMDYDEANEWHYPSELQAEITRLRADVERLTRERDRLQGVVERDRTKAAEIIATARAVVSRRSWLAEGRGSFSYDDEKYQEEFVAAITEMLEALQPLGVLAADWSDCPKDFQAARIDWKARAETAERKLVMAVEKLKEILTYPREGEEVPASHRSYYLLTCVQGIARDTLTELEKADG
jgi:hypothetical protein